MVVDGYTCRGVARIFRGGFVTKKNLQRRAKRDRFWLRPLLTSTLLDRADSLSGCSRAISLSSRAISSSSSWSSPLLPRQEPLVSVSGSGESRSLHSLLASSRPRQPQYSAKKHQCEAGTNLEDPVEKNSVMDLYPPQDGIRRRFDILTSLPTCQCKWAVQYIVTPSYVMITGKRGIRANPSNPPWLHPCTWLYMVIHGYTWLHMIISGYTWL